MQKAGKIAHQFYWCNQYCASLEEGMVLDPRSLWFKFSFFSWWLLCVCFRQQSFLVVVSLLLPSQYPIKCVFVVYSEMGGWRLETIKECWKMKDILCFLSMLLLFWNLTEILLQVISQTCFNILKKKPVFGLGCALSLAWLTCCRHNAEPRFWLNLG